MYHHHQGRPSGCIEVICGPMFSGKTEELIRRLRLAQIARQRIQIFKPALDNRYSEVHIESHNEQRFECTPIPNTSKLLELVHDQTRVVGIDEAQFFDDNIVHLCQRLANRGLRVVVAGLDQDYLGQPFGPMPALMAIAESVLKLKAVCMVCGGLATHSQRLTRETSQVVVGALDHYEARCRACFDPQAQLAQNQPLFTLADAKIRTR